MKDIKEAREYILDQLPPSELLAQLAEEATELAHAALKYRRTLNTLNPTPISGVEALRNLREEIADVQLVIELLELDWGPEYTQGIKNVKQARWARRLKEARK